MRRQRVARHPTPALNGENMAKCMKQLFPSSASVASARAPATATPPAAEMARAHEGRDWAEAGEEFSDHARRMALHYIEADTDESNTLDFDEFCALVKRVEAGTHTDDELRARFVSLDANGNGTIERNEYILYSLVDALGRSMAKVADLFAKMVCHHRAPTAALMPPQSLQLQL